MVTGLCHRTLWSAIQCVKVVPVVSNELEGAVMLACRVACSVNYDLAVRQAQLS